MNDNLIIDGKEFRSRLFIGTGKHKSLKDLENYITSSESEMITVAIRRLDLDDNQSNDLLSFLIEKKLEIPAYEKCIKASHFFNLLDARGVLSVSERASYIKRVREISKSCCELHIEKQETV